MQTLAQGKYIKVVEPVQKLVGINLLKVTLKCACCSHDLPTFEIMSDRLPEWQDKIKNESKFQPLCKSCVKAHKKWHNQKIEQDLKSFAKELWEEYQLLCIPSKEGPVYRKVFDRLTEILGLERDWMLLATNHKEETSVKE